VTGTRADRFWFQGSQLEWLDVWEGKKSACMKIFNE
jgi:hypothetical protein